MESAQAAQLKPQPRRPPHAGFIAAGDSATASKVTSMLA
jgi:hypothetical protein